MLPRTFASLSLAIFLGASLSGSVQAADTVRSLRPPAVPLVACDPYFSIWSCADRLNDDATRHWTGKKQALSSMIRVDGKVYRLMGDQPKEVPAFPQVGLRVLPTRTITHIGRIRYDIAACGQENRRQSTRSMCDDGPLSVTHNRRPIW